MWGRLMECWVINSWISRKGKDRTPLWSYGHWKVSRSSQAGRDISRKGGGRWVLKSGEYHQWGSRQHGYSPAAESEGISKSWIKYQVSIMR